MFKLLCFGVGVSVRVCIHFMHAHCTEHTLFPFAVPLVLHSIALPSVCIFYIHTKQSKHVRCLVKKQKKKKGKSPNSKRHTHTHNKINKMQKCSDAIVFTITTMLCRWFRMLQLLLMLLLLLLMFSSLYSPFSIPNFGCDFFLLSILAYGVCDKSGSKITKTVIK